MKFIFERQVENARWRAAAEFDERMSKRHQLEMTVNAVDQFCDDNN